MVRTVGVEEELLLFDPATREVAAAAPALLKELREHGAGRRPPRAWCTAMACSGAAPAVR